MLRSRHPRRARSGLVAGLGAVAACLVLTSCLNPAGTPRERAGQCQVGVVGDSLTVGSQAQGGLEDRLTADGCTVTPVDAVIGRSTASGAEVVEAWAEAGTLPSVLVVELGTNDCSASDFEAAARRILTSAGPTRPVVWVTTWRAGCDDAVNAVIERLQAEDRSDGADRLWVLDHHAWIAEHRDLLAGDGIHLTAAGYEAYAQRLATAVGEPESVIAAADSVLARLL